MSSAKPSLELLRSLTEEHILTALMAEGRLTRAEIAARSGISKPTISVGVRRLEEAGIILDTGEYSTGRGRAGNYYNLAPACGVGLVAAIAPGAVIAETVDPFGTVTSREVVELDRAPGTEGAARALSEAARKAVAAADRPVRTTVISAADPVDRASGQLVHLPDAPFMIGELDPTDVLADIVGRTVLVDNDVNWAARAERSASDLEDPDNFVYLHLGQGLGFAVVSDGRVWRGHRGLAGEIAHVVTTGPDKEAMRFTEVFARLGLRHERSTSIDVDRVVASFADAEDDTTLAQLAQAVAGVLSAAIAFADPSAAVVGGEWGREPAFIAALQAQFDDAPRDLRVRASVLEDRPELAGARAACLQSLRDAIIASVPSLH